MRFTRTRSESAARTALATAVVVASLAGVGVGLTSQAAYADPGAVASNQLVGVGSDTIQDVMNALSGATVNGVSYSATAVGADGKSIASYDAVEPNTGSTTSTITPKANGATFARPNGSGAGRVALSDSIDNGSYNNGSGGTVNISGQVDFSRSSSGPKVTGTALTYIPLARDAVGFVAKNDALRQLTIEQLKEIYTGNLTSYHGVAIHPYIPQAGSGTRSFFEKALGLTDAQLGADVTPTEENQADNAITVDGAIMPFSAASWSAQLNGIAPDHSKTAMAGGAFMGSLELDPVNNLGVFTSPVTTAADGTITPTAAYYNDPAFGRDVYNVVPTREVDQSSIFFDQAIYDVFVTSGAHVAAIETPAAKAVIAKFGFVNEAYAGSIDPSNHAKLGGLEDSGLSLAVPGAVTGLAATSPSATNLHAAWTAPTGAPVSDYRVTVTKTADNSVVSAQDLPAATTTLDLTGLAAGAYSVSVTAANLNGLGTAASAPVTVGAVATATTVTAKTLAAAPYGTWQPVTVTVAPTAGSPVPTGKVTLSNGYSATLDATGKATLWYLTTQFSMGAKSFTVSYAGDANNLASSTQVATTIVKATPALTVTGPTRFSHTVHERYTVSIYAARTVMTGYIRIYDGTRLLGTFKLVNGKVVATLPLLGRGVHHLSFRYLGNGQLNAVAKPLTVTVV